MTALRIGILGAAAIAPKALIEPAQHLAGVRVTAIAARDVFRAQAFASKYGIDTVHANYQTLVDDPNIDAVYIPLPNALHGTWTMRALRAGKHVLCEKPFTANAREAHEVRDLTRETGQTVMEAFHWRYHPMNGRLLNDIAHGRYGETTSIDAAFCFPLLQASDIRWNRNLAGGSLMDLGCYTVHMIRSVCKAAGLAEPQVGETLAAFTHRGVDRSMRASLSIAQNAHAKARCGMLDFAHPVAIHLKFAGTQGSARVFNPILPHLGGHVISNHNGKRSFDRAERTTSYHHQLVAFRDAIIDGTPFPTTVDDAAANMEIIDEMHRAAGINPPVPAES